MAFGLGQHLPGPFLSAQGDNIASWDTRQLPLPPQGPKRWTEWESYQRPCQARVRTYVDANDRLYQVSFTPDDETHATRWPASMFPSSLPPEDTTAACAGPDLRVRGIWLDGWKDGRIPAADRDWG